MDVSSTNATPVSTVVQNTTQDPRQPIERRPEPSQEVRTSSEASASAPSSDSRVGSTIDTYV